MRLKNKVAVVTGGSQGIGKAIGKMFAREGEQVVVAARMEEKLRRVQSEIEGDGGQALAMTTDVGREEDVERLTEATVERFGGLDVLVNNAGIGLRRPVDDVDMVDYDRVLDTNLRGHVPGVPVWRSADEETWARVDHQCRLSARCGRESPEYGVCGDQGRHHRMHAGACGRAGPFSDSREYHQPRRHPGGPEPRGEAWPDS